MRAFNGQVAVVVNFVAETRHAFRHAGDPHRGRPKMNASLALTITQRNAEDGHGFSGARQSVTSIDCFNKALRHSTCSALLWERNVYSTECLFPPQLL